MTDLEVAERRLHNEKVAMTIVKESKVLFETRSHRISGFLEAIDRCATNLENASIADRVAGKAVALLCVYVRAKAVYADVLSKKAKTVLDDNGITCEWKELVENILDSSKSGLCPFEQVAARISDANEAHHVFRQLQKNA